MEILIRHILVSTTCLSIAYLFYLLFLTKDVKFKILRFYFIFAIISSLVLPFSNYSIDESFFFVDRAKSTSSEMENTILTFLPMENLQEATPYSTPLGRATHWGLKEAIFYVYTIVTSILFLNLLKQIVSIMLCYIRSERSRMFSIPVQLNSDYDEPFSFVNWIFVNRKLRDDREIKEIIVHESVHVKQYHWIDLLLIETVCILMWFNPLIWALKNSIKLVHEYLADEGVLKTGFDKLKYQALLINQIAGGRLISITSHFNHSTVKKRIKMMIQKKKNQITELKMSILVPFITVLFFGIVGFVNKPVIQSIDTAGTMRHNSPINYTNAKKIKNGETTRKIIESLFGHPANEDISKQNEGEGWKYSDKESGTELHVLLDGSGVVLDFRFFSEKIHAVAALNYDKVKRIKSTNTRSDVVKEFGEPNAINLGMNHESWRYHGEPKRYLNLLFEQSDNEQFVYNYTERLSGQNSLSLDPIKVQQIEKNSSTIRDVLANFGNPTARSVNSDSRMERWFYQQPSSSLMVEFYESKVSKYSFHKKVE